MVTMRKPAWVRSLHTSEALQRLNAGDLTYAYLVGLFEGDGYFSVSRKGIYLLYEVGIEFSIRDVQLIYKIKAFLGVGVVGFRTRNGCETVYLRIRNKSHLKNFILPIFDRYSMFSNKQYDYLNLKKNLLSGVILSKDLLPYERSDVNINTIESILSSPYFSA
jgi:ubiquinol-cytochrome c reductase cytochrome b subunit